MKSKIDIPEFRNRLKIHTKIGMPSLKIQWGFLSIFADNSEWFYGKFDNSAFELIKNSNFFPSFYCLKGTYKKTEENLIVNYSIEPIDKSRIGYIKYFPIVAFIIFNGVFYFQAKPPLEVYIIFNLFIVFIFFFSKVYVKWQNKKLKRKFNKIFEITD